jgi:ABC-type antimicrobial peptide transport system permease subunit
MCSGAHRRSSAFRDLAIASTVVLLTAMAAVMVTARKALRVDPIEVLRTP